MSDPAKYRSREEVEDARKSGPIKSIQNLIVSSGVREEELKVVDEEVRKIVSEAAEFALNSDLPLEDELFKDITIN